MMISEQIIIIGGGPAGCACAIQLKRYGFDPLIIEKDMIGGLVKNAWRMDNYVGYYAGISGVKMVEELQKHLRRFDIRIQYSKFSIQDFSGGEFEGVCDGKKYYSKYLVLATGTKPKYQGEGYTEVYPLRKVKGKKIAIVGAGDAAFDYAMSLAPQNTVHIHNRGSNIKCIPALLELALKQDGITYFENSVPSGSYDYTIFATGREPNMDCLSPDIIKMRKQLEQDGLLYFIGDVKNGMVRQASVAIGDGIKAAMAIHDRIRNK